LLLRKATPGDTEREYLQPVHILERCVQIMATEYNALTWKKCASVCNEPPDMLL
jgi:hypothetical protein